MVRRIAFSLLFITVSVIAYSLNGWAYEETVVMNGGTLKGRVVLDGPPPPARVYHLVFSPNIEFCQKISDGHGNRLLYEFKASADGGFEDVIVSVVGVKKGKPFQLTPTLWLEDCQIRPFVTPIRNNHPITIASNDPVTHDIQAYTLDGNDYTFAMFNQPMPARASVLEEVRLRQGHFIFRTQCGVHDYMQSWGMAVGNPYYAVTDEAGMFEIADIPPGTYYVLAWHPHMKVQAQEVTITPGGTVEMGFIFNASEVRIPLHDLQTSYRLQPWLDERQVVPPKKMELQIHNAPEKLLQPKTWQERRGMISVQFP